MAITLPLESMSVEEKISAMESLWDSLCSQAGGVVSPSWHGELLAQREQSIVDGTDQFETWEQAKKDIRKQIP